MGRLHLIVRCRECGREFDTGIRMDRRDFARATFAANYHRCPGCGHRGTYRKEDYGLAGTAPRVRLAPPSGGDV